MTARFPDPILRIILEYDIKDIKSQLIKNKELTLPEAARCFEILKILRCECIDSFMLQFACINGKIEVAEYLKEKYSITKDDHPEIIRSSFDGCNTSTISQIYMYSNLESIMWFTDAFDIQITHFDFIFAWACIDGRLDILIWMKQKFGNSKNSGALQTGLHLDQKYFFQNNGIYAFCCASSNGNLEVLKWLKGEFDLNKKNLVISPISDPYWHARTNHRYGVMKWLEKEKLYYYNPCVIL